MLIIFILAILMVIWLLAILMIIWCYCYLRHFFNTYEKGKEGYKIGYCKYKTFKSIIENKKHLIWNDNLYHNDIYNTCFSLSSVTFKVNNKYMIFNPISFLMVFYYLTHEKKIYNKKNKQKIKWYNWNKY